MNRLAEWFQETMAGRGLDREYFEVMRLLKQHGQCTLSEPAKIHVFPCREEKMHTLIGINCSCKPKIEEYPETRRTLVIHNESS